MVVCFDLSWWLPEGPAKGFALFPLTQNSLPKGGEMGGIYGKRLKVNTVIATACHLGQGKTVEANNRQSEKFERKG